MRIVLDVNVWISGLLWGGIPSKFLHLARNERITIFASQALFLELETTLRRAKFQSRLEMRGYTVESLMSVAEGFSESCSTEVVDVPELRDPDDIVILETANSANAKVIITGDLDLLVLNEFNGIQILTPQVFLSRHFPDML
ncbi:putative toxin-antitoxin system toxin component, PIN family [Nostoc sp. MG11]|uniref:putative toxin-antitoxin system toxin component, PIN family n=1 Tax=Nostoc sp. MG11 TaxID=2721166 RepID=UPI0018660752|nr:putative toxin-antitoxin system toxin component, PIN family [Nostoc sp. MG11]